MKRLITICLPAFFIFMLIGCQTASKKDSIKTEGLIEPSNFFKFADVPVPNGFKLVQDESFSFENGGVRVGVLKYRGKANQEQLINFYKEQMAMYNWNMLNIIEYGQSVLNFERDSETCIVTLSSKGSADTITISMGPKAQAISKKTKQTLK